jgi:hypothetical protein
MTNVFNPVVYSLEENAFLLTHLGELSAVAFDGGVPTGVNMTTLKPVLDRVYDLNQLKEIRGLDWVGVKTLKEAITVYLNQQQSWVEIQRKGGPRFPSMHTFDGKGRPHFQGPGSDSQRVSTYFGRDGKRHPFSVELHSSDATWVAPWTEIGMREAPKDLIIDTENRRVECAVCKHTESFKADSRSSFNAAKARMSKHLKSTTDDVDIHREYYTNIKGG